VIGFGKGLLFWVARMARVVITMIYQWLSYAHRLVLSGHSVANHHLTVARESLYKPIERGEDC
jgi:hypothetical protein